MLGKIFFFFCQSGALLYALNVEPWYRNLWEFTFSPSYTYDYFRSIQRGRPSSVSSNNHLLLFHLDFPPSVSWELDTELEFAATSFQGMGFRSSGWQARYLWLDDVAGDPISLTTGWSFRGVSRRNLKDLDCPYHATLNFEGNISCGKEWGHPNEGYLRACGFGALGWGNKGSLWVRFLGRIEKNIAHSHRWQLSLQGYFGLGHQVIVNTLHFNGYGSIRHKSLDCTLEYSYLFRVWGELSFSYSRRVYARSFPQGVNFFMIKYLLPFSLF